MPAAAKAPDLAVWQPHLDFLLPRKATLHPTEIADAVGLDRRTVERAFEGPARDASGKLVRPWLLGFAFNAAGGERFTRRIPRAYTVLWLAHSANYPDPAQVIDAITEVAADRSLPELLILQQRISAFIRRAQA